MIAEEEVIVADQVQTYDPFDGNPSPPEDKVETIVAPIVEEKKIEPIVEVKSETIPALEATTVIEEKKIEPVIEKKAEQEPFKYANEESKKIHELILEGKTKDVLKILNEQDRLDSLLTAPLDAKTAKDILMLKLEKDFNGLSPELKEYRFNKLYGTGKEPVQKITEDEDDFLERQNEWKEKVANAEKDLLIDAELAKPDLAKFKIDLQLPAIQSQAQSFQPPTPEELEADRKEAESFLVNSKAAIDKFAGFSVTYKDKDVDIQTTYSLSDEEKTVVMGKMSLLAEKNYNANALFAERWVNDDNTYNFDQIAKDLATLETSDKSSQKFVSDTTAKAKLAFIKSKVNVDLGETKGGELQLEDKTTQQKNEDAIWN